MPAKFLVGEIVGAQGVAVQQQCGGASNVWLLWFIEQGEAAGSGKFLADEEITITGQEDDGGGGCAGTQGGADAGIERVSQVVISSPVFEQVTEDVEGGGGRGDVGEKVDE